MLKKGEKVQELTFQVEGGKEHTLSDFSENKAVVFFFYPKDFTPGCTKQACSFRDHYGEIRELGGAIFGISLDDESSHDAFREKYKLPFSLISDPDAKLSKIFGAKRRFGFGPLKTRRATFMVAPSTGEIIEAFSHEFNMAFHAEKVIEVLEKM